MLQLAILAAKIKFLTSDNKANSDKFRLFTNNVQM